MGEPHPTYARIASLQVPKRFISANDNQFSAIVSFENDSDLVHSAQVVFRGYVRAPDRNNNDPKKEKKEKRRTEDKQEEDKKSDERISRQEKEKDKEKKKDKEKRRQPADDRLIHYEFLHEQVWLIIDKTGRVSHEAFLDVWLPRFPPSGPIYQGGPVVEYSCRVSVDPWYENHHMEKTFEVHRTLILKQPHIAAYPNHIKVNRCVDHGGMFHKQCKPVNGEIWTEKGAYVPGEKFKVRWKLMHADTLSDAKVSLIRTVLFRTPDAGVPQMYERHVDVAGVISLAEQRQKDEKERKDNNDDRERYREENCVGLVIPEQVCVSMPMCVYNVMAVKYEVLLQVKVGKQKNFTDFTLPIIVVTDPIESRPNKKKPSDKSKLYQRAADIDDDSGDDDDTDSEIDESPDKAAEERREYSIEIEHLAVATKANGQLHNAYAEVHILVNSHVARSLHALRLMFTGECRAGSSWYEFLRYKAIISTNEATALSPGGHVVKVALPFSDTQYDTNILAPSLDDDIKYTCRVTFDSWTRNAIQAEREVFVDRFVDTWAKKEFHPPYDEQMGAWGVKMRQRNFMRGKYAFAKVTGDYRSVRLQLMQRRRLRIPGVSEDDSYCHERLISQMESPENRDIWPSEWAVEIPKYIQPSIEISYWNVLVLDYTLAVFPRGHDGHEHRHNIPIWIGCNDDKLDPPERIIPSLPPDSQLVRVPSEASLPEFEVWDREEVKIQPWWVERFNRDTYTFFDDGHEIIERDPDMLPEAPRKH